MPGAKIRQHTEDEGEFEEPEGLPQTLMFWHKRALIGNFDPDTHIADPEHHFEWLEDVHQHVLLASEFYCCYGAENPSDIILRRLSLPNVARNLLAHIMPEGSAQAVTGTRSRTSESHKAEEDERQQLPGRKASQPEDLIRDIRGLEAVLKINSGNSTLHSQLRIVLEVLGRNYLILCSLLNSLNLLRVSKFCDGSYSILIQHPDPGIAEIVAIPQSALEEMKVGVEATIGKIAGYPLSVEELQSELSECIVEPACSLLRTMRFTFSIDISQSLAPALALYSITLRLLDLALVAYAGSHATRFDQRLGMNTREFDMWTDYDQVDGFRCSLKRLACLDGFLDSNPVWVFERLPDDTTKLGPSERENSEPLSLLCQMNAFADLWGPVWAIMSEGSHSIRQYNVSKGFIAAVQNDGELPAMNGAIPCHWYSMPMDGRRMSEFQYQSIEGNDFLLIGAFLQKNQGCTYTLDDFEADYRFYMAPIETTDPSWRLDTRMAGINAGMYVGMNLSGTQKLVPGVSLKDSIWNKLIMSPEVANPCFLLHRLGVEISHCTGNARRIVLRDLLLMSRVQQHLNILYPGWQTTEWAEQLLNLKENNMRELLFWWQRHEANRVDIAKVIRCLLNFTHNTGPMGDFLAACFFTQYEQRSVPTTITRNMWARCLQDSRTSAAYVIIGDKCLRYGEPRTPRCTNDPALTALETSIQTYIPPEKAGPRKDIPLETTGEGDYIRLFPAGDVLRRTNPMSRRQICLKTADQHLALPRGILRPIEATASEQLLCAGDRIERVYPALIQSSAMSYGGRVDRRNRHRTRVQQLGSSGHVEVINIRSGQRAIRARNDRTQRHVPERRRGAVTVDIRPRERRHESRCC